MPHLERSLGSYIRCCVNVSRGAKRHRDHDQLSRVGKSVKSKIRSVYLSTSQDGYTALRISPAIRLTPL